MKYNYEFDMKYTDNPYIDLIVQCVKILGMNAVIKNENQALHYEDVRSARAAARYIKFKEGLWNERRDGPYNEWNYMEWNSYYRMLNGEPPAYTMNDEKAYLDATGYGDEIYEDIGSAWIIPELYKRYFIDMGQYTLPEEVSYNFNLEGKYLHELSIEELSVIESCGIMKQIFADYSEDPHYQYIYHLGDKRVDYHTARTAINFSLLWIPELSTFDIIEHKFRRVYERNRRYTMSTIYSEAYRFMSYHYDAFLEILIIIQTMVDMISEVQEYIINKDVFDTRTIRYLFESYGIAYYKEIPVKYQIRIIKNVNTLLKYKSSHRNITDILELFDDDSIVVYTYYLMKTKKINRDDFFFYTKDDVNPKYNTNRNYWIGNPKDISNNKLPLTNVKYNEDEPDFIKKYLYNYEIIYKDTDDIPSNRLLSNNQPVVGMIVRPLESIVKELAVNSFVDSYLRDTNWFNEFAYNYNSASQGINYLVNRNTYLTALFNALSNRVKNYLTKLCENTENMALNQYYYRRLKYELYGILGVFDAEILKSETFETMTDIELEQYFYQEDTLVTDAYRVAHSLPEDSYGEDNEDRFILNHSIPYLVYFEYKKDEPIENYEIAYKAYMFRNDNSFSIYPESYPDDYDRWLATFRKNYLIAVRSYIEGIFSDFELDAVNNPTPRYIGWMDLNYVIGQTGKGIDELETGELVTTIDRPNIPIYTSAYVYEIITEDMVGQEFFRKNYDLCFLKVPILDPNAYKVLERYDMRRNYDAITLADPFWDGVSTFDLLTEEERARLHQSKKQEILNKEFTIERTKYIAVEASIDLTKMSYQVCYFMNMLYDKHRDEESLYVDVDKEVAASGRVRLNDLLTFALALNYLYQGVEPDNIASDMEKNMYINGFNFDNNWSEIYTYLQNQHHIYNNYLNELHDYTYIDEFGESHDVKDGYGMSPLYKGYLTELYEDFYVYKVNEDGSKIQSYLGKPIYGYDEFDRPIYYDPESYFTPSSNPINARGRIDENGKIKVTDDATEMPIDNRIGAFLSGRYEQCDDDCITSAKFDLDFGYSDIWVYNLQNAVNYNWLTEEISTMDISWSPTQYPKDDNNSHGLWLTTAILPLLDESLSDLERINMLKKIYYTNTNLYDHLTYMMRHAESKRMYDIYKIVFDSYMETKMNHDFYKLADSNGNPVYTDENEEGTTYRIDTISFIDKDEHEFPYFIGTVYDELGNIVSTDKYEFHHNEDFTECYYQGINNGEIYDCIANTLLNEEKEYKLYTDYKERLPYGFFWPIDDSDRVHIFELSTTTYTFLINSKDETIKIPIILNPDNSITYITDTTIEGITVVELEEGGIQVTIEKEDGEIIEKTMNLTWKIASDYYEFLQYRNLELYENLIDIKYNYDNVYDHVSKTYKPSDEKRVRIETLCELIVIALEKYFDRDEWRFIFNLIPTANVKNIQDYIMKMVIFFKSWKTQILDTSITYVIDDPFGNYVQILDDMYMNVNYEFLDKIRPRDYKYFHVYTEYRDPITIRDDISFKTIDIKPYWIEIGFGEKIYGHRFDYPSFTSTLSPTDKVSPREAVEIKPVYYN